MRFAEYLEGLPSTANPAEIRGRTSAARNVQRMEQLAGPADLDVAVWSEIVARLSRLSREGWAAMKRGGIASLLPSPPAARTRAPKE